MTREEAIEELKRDIHNAKVTHHLSEHYEMAIKALEILEEFEKAQIITGGRLNGRTYAYKCGLEDGKRKALEQEPKTGHWIMSDDGLYRPICNNCGAHPWKGYIPTVEEATEVFKYCPNCGAKMLPTDLQFGDQDTLMSAT